MLQPGKDQLSLARPHQCTGSVYENQYRLLNRLPVFADVELLIDTFYENDISIISWYSGIVVRWRNPKFYDNQFFYQESGDIITFHFFSG